MRDSRRIGRSAVLVGALAFGQMAAQEPAARGAGTRGGATIGGVSAAALAASKEDPAAVDRGTKVYATYCAGCHGNNGRGGPGAPDLVRSLLVLDDEKGILIAPVIREGRPDAGMPKLNLTEPQIADVVAWLHVQTYAAGHRTTYAYQDIVTGDAKKGEAFFNAKCGTCHSATGDLKGVGARYEPLALQGKWLQPRGGRGGATTRNSVMVTVTPASGPAISGKLDRIDDFNVALHDARGEYHSFTREGLTPKVELKDPVQAHTDLLRVYTDADIHNMTAYLVTLK